MSHLQKQLPKIRFSLGLSALLALAAGGCFAFAFYREETVAACMGIAFFLVAMIVCPGPN